MEAQEGVCAAALLWVRAAALAKPQPCVPAPPELSPPHCPPWSPSPFEPCEPRHGGASAQAGAAGRILQGTIEHYQTQLQSYFTVCCRYWALIAVIVTVTELGTLAVIRTVVLSCVTIWREARKEATSTNLLWCSEGEPCTHQTQLIYWKFRWAGILRRWGNKW